METKALVICGPTASGKTALDVAMAKRLQTEIISADCMLVYRGLDIGTAKPSLSEREGILHHMIDVAEPTDSYSVSDYEKAALPVVESLLQRGKTPVICGGTGFYINALLFAQKFGNAPADAAVRLKYETIAKERGREYLHSLLRECDAESAATLHYNDVKRVVRALEIFELTGRKKSEQKDEPIPRFPYVAVCLDYPRKELYERIEKRVDVMFGQGLVEEVRALLRGGVPPTAQSMQGIGYKEAVELVGNPSLRSTVSDIIKQNTRNYAKRQITFFKKLPNLIYLAPDCADNENIIMEYLCKEQNG